MASITTKRLRISFVPRLTRSTLRVRPLRKPTPERSSNQTEDEAPTLLSLIASVPNETPTPKSSDFADYRVANCAGATGCRGRSSTGRRTETADNFCQDHNTNVLCKTGAENRAQLIAHLTDGSAADD